MAWKVPPVGKGLGEIHPVSRKLAADRPHQDGNKADRKTFKSLKEFRIGL
jgi:hypothetical protein